GSTSEMHSQSPFPFSYEDVYGEKKEKRIACRFSHLPPQKTKALLRGIMQESESFSSEESLLLQQLKYQHLRLKIPTILEEGTLQLDGEFSGVITDDAIFMPLLSAEKTETTPFVCDLLVEGDASYMITPCLAHNGGKRKGAMCAYLETWHLDIEDFLELRKNTGDERRRTHDMNTANWVPDLFMKRVKSKGMWTLFSPSDTPDLHDLYGQAFEKRYEEYEKMVDEGQIKLYKKVEAEILWRKMLSMLFETGHPWITFKDPSNICSMQDHVGVVHSSNLCTEILLNTSADEVAVCNLGSVNLKEHVQEGKLNKEKLQQTITMAVRMLDNVIDINFYPIVEAKNANLRHRPVGLGMMGFQDALYLLDISYQSEKAAQFADESMEVIAYYAYEASSDLAKERGKYSSYKGSKWDRGILPPDTLDLVEKDRGVPIDLPRGSTMDWDRLRKKIQQQGMRNSHVLAIAPTATIANIAGVIPSIEPAYKHLFVKSNLSGEFTITNPHLVDRLKLIDLWDEEMIDDLKYFDGSIQEIERIPEEIKELFLTSFEIDPFWIIECAARRQKWLDMGQSLNLYLAQPSGKKLHEMYLLAWEKRLKTNYYLRTLAATQIEKSSTDVNRRGLQPRWMKSKSASGNIQVQRGPERPLSCSLEEGCESCQ
ncbi:MAG: ribonucleoside-diphosphate reductase subunit alpha, partial [Chlamydiota bacterium]